MPVIGFVDLDRRFRDLTDAELEHNELEDAETFASLDGLGLGSSIGWTALLEHARVVLLAEAGAGKTTEMVEQAERLAGEGQFAFCVPLESLDREPFTGLLSRPDEEKFEAWKADGNAPGWFFLDAVDELKLTSGKLDRALGRLSREIDSHLDRARVIVSCRPSDWRSSLDLKTMQNRLPVPERVGEIDAPPPEEVFMGALRHEPAEAVSFSHQKQEDLERDTVRTVAMLPMSDGQIEVFAEQSGVSDAATFLAEVAQHNAWDFARRPLDLADLIANWTRWGRLGTRAEQHEANVAAKLRDNPERPDRDVLTDSQARHGAESLALALALTRRRTIRSPEQAADIHPEEGVLQAEAILPGWTEAQRQALLRRALFDPATYGRVRFHHRSVQEYLAAWRLRRLREKGMSTSALFRLLFVELYGAEVVRPSMRAIAAWLALWDDAVRTELIEREPEALLLFGDPATLEVQARGHLVGAFVAKYGQGGWRGLDIPVDEVRRLSHPELATVVRECWKDGAANIDVRQLLVEMIWQGPIEACADLACSAALDASGDHHCRIAAIRALIACGRDETVRECASAMLAEPASWPDEVVSNVAAGLFPGIISADDLVMLMEQRHEAESVSWGFNWASQRIAESVEPWSEPAITLRNKMADLIWRRREQQQEPYHIRGEYSYFAPGLAMLCERQLSEVAGEPQSGLIRACVIASRFGADETGVREALEKLQAHFETNASLRSAGFWAELAFMDEIAPTDDDLNRLFNARQDGLVGHLTEADRPWLETGLADESQPERRPAALHALIELWRGRGGIGSELEAIRQHLKGDANLDRILAGRTAPPKRDEHDEKMEEFERKRRRRQSAHAEREAKRLENWRRWREWLVDNLDEAFSAEKRNGTLSTINRWLREYKQDSSRFNKWDKEALTRALGPDAANRVETAFRELWRTKPPVLWSARAPEARNSLPHEWIQGLVGVSAESSKSGWAKTLSSGEARTAAAYATIELNGFAPFITDLAESHPCEVEEIIGVEVSAEIKIGDDYEHLPTLQNLGYADSNLKRLLVPRLLAELKSWPAAFTDESGPRWLHHLERVLRLLGEANCGQDREAIALECARRYETDPTGPLAVMWLKGLFQFDAVCGARVMTNTLGDGNDPEISVRAIKTFAALFGGYSPVVLDMPAPSECARVLGDLVRCAYAFVRREDDLVHKGTYSSNTRDDAQSARNFLLSRLLDTPGSEARRIVLELAGEDNFAHFPDRLRLLARQRTAAEAEFQPFDPAAVIALEENLEAPPQDNEGLFTVIMDRLGDIAHDLRHHDFSIRKTVQSITEESEMQRNLAWLLEFRANGVYRVAREEEVADRKRTDIRILAVRGGQKAVVEVKVADNGWSLTQLEKALQDQLVGQYLRHTDCKAGCLLLTYRGEKNYWKHPATRKRMPFPEIVAFLREKARRIETKTSHDVRLSVFGLDLTDPTFTSDRRAS